MAIRTIDDSILQDIAVAIQGKDGGGQMTVDEMPARIDNIPSGEPTVANPALILMDWEGTKLGEYSAEGVLALTELPAPSTLPAYATADHELLSFQNWNWSIEDIKAWVQNHAGHALTVGAIYTTTDSQDHNYWNNPRLDGVSTAISMQKRATTSIGINAFKGCTSLTQINIPDGVTSIGGNAFQNCYALTKINIPNSVTSIGDNAFQNCYALTQINIPNSVTSIGGNAFNGCYSLTQINIPDGVTNIVYYTFHNCYSLTRINIPDGVTNNRYNAFENCYSLTQINIPDSVTSIGSNVFLNCKCLNDVLLESKPTLVNTSAFSGLPTNYRIYVPRANLSWFETETNWSTIYTQGHIVAIEDYIEYLESIGFNVDEYKEVSA